MKNEDYKYVMGCRRTGSGKKGQRSIMTRRRGGGGEYAVRQLQVHVNIKFQ